MCTYWANLRCIITDKGVTTVTTLPDGNFFGLKDYIVINIFDQFAVAFFVLFFNCANAIEFVSDFVKTFFTGDTGELFVHVSPFVIFTSGGNFEVGPGVSYSAVIEVLVPKFGVFFLIVRGFSENFSNLFVTILFCTRSKELVFYTSLGFSSKSGF